MPVITKIIEQKRHPNRRNVYLDGKFSFGCNVTVVARFRLRPNLNLTIEQVREIEQGEVRQECFDAAMGFLQHRLHSRAELFRKLNQRSIALDGGKRHLSLEGRCVVPTGSSCHGLS